MLQLIWPVVDIHLSCFHFRLLGIVCCEHIMSFDECMHISLLGIFLRSRNPMFDLGRPCQRVFKLVIQLTLLPAMCESPFIPHSC